MASKPTPAKGETAAKKPAAKAASKPAAAAKPAAKKPVAAKPAPAANAPAPPPAPEPLAAPDLMRLVSPQQRELMETLSANLARAAVTVQGAIAEAALRSADRPAALNLDPFHVAPALTEVMGALAAQPDRLMRAQAELFSQYMELWRTTAARVGVLRSRMVGKSDVRRDEAVLPLEQQLPERAGGRGRDRRSGR